MIDDRPHRAAGDPASALPRRFRAWLGLSPEPALLPRPRTAQLEPIRRSWLAAFWQARISVRAGVPLDDFLRSRVARYFAALPVARARLPLEIDVDDGQLVVHPAGPERGAAPAATDDADAWLAPLIAMEGPAVRHEVAELEVRLTVLEGEIEGARKRTEEISRRLAGDVAVGLVPAPSTVEATAEQLGRPPVPSAAPHATMLAFAGAALAAETWQIALPLLRAAGLDPAWLAVESRAQPAAVGFVAVFALGVSAGLFALSHAGLAAASAIFEGEDDLRRRRWLVAAATGAGALACLVATALSGMPAAPGAVAAPRATFVLLLLAVPLATALLLRAARKEKTRRDRELAGALEWDRERARSLGERARRLEELSWAGAEEAGLAHEHEAARRRLRDLSLRAVAATRLGEEADRRERAALSHLAQSIVSALELDRYEFVRQASARGAAELVAPRLRRPAGDVRPTIVEAPALTPAPLQTAVEGGRLAAS